MITREILHSVLEYDSDVEIHERIGESGYRISSVIPGLEDLDARATMVVTNDVNPVMLQMFAPVSADHLNAAVDATSVIGVVGLGTMGEGSYALRHGIFLEHSDIPAMTNGIRSLAMAYCEYVKRGGI